MASHSEYVHGEMSIVGQDKTYQGFLKVSLFLTAFFIVILLFPILMFAVHLSWMSSLIITFIVGLIIAYPFRLSGSWFMTLGGMAVLTLIFGFLISALT